MKPELGLLLEIRATLAAPIVVGDVPEGARRVVPIAGGTFEGRGCAARWCPAEPTGSTCARMG